MEDQFNSNSIGKILYNYYATVLKVCEPNLYALMIDLGFSTHKRINIKLFGLGYLPENNKKIIDFANNFLKNTEYKIMYFSLDPDSNGYMQGVIKSHDGIFNLNKLLVDNGLMFVK